MFIALSFSCKSGLAPRRVMCIFHLLSSHLGSLHFIHFNLYAAFILRWVSWWLYKISLVFLANQLPYFFIVTFKSFTFKVIIYIHLEFIFVYGVSWCSTFIFLHVTIQLSQHYLMKRLFLLHFMLFCQILIDRKDLSLFLGSLFCSIGLCICSYASTRLFWLPWPCNTLWYQVLWSLLLCSYFSKLLWLFWVIYGSI